MIKEAIDRILELAVPNIIENNGRTYTDKAMRLIPQPHVETLEFRTLSGFAEAIKSDTADIFPIIIKVDKASVCAFTRPSSDDKMREKPYSTVADIPNFVFGRFMPYEEMMIALKSKFCANAELSSLVQMLGTIIEENHTAVSDDGFTQSVNVKKGVALVSSAAIKPIVKLAPYRTFVEIEQPESEFLVRLREGGQVALFEADGGAWKNAARERIAEYLRKEFDVEKSDNVPRIQIAI